MYMKNIWEKLNKRKKPILALAPMAGISDSAFRLVCKNFGADVVYTEMVSADALHFNSKKTLELLKFNKKERPIIVQLFGKHPERFIKASSICEKAGFDGIDINFGCPARKVAGRGGGVSLMKDLPKCKKIIQNVLAGSSLPVSVKLRSSIGIGVNKITALDFIDYMKDLPINAIMIHGRCYEKPFLGEIDYQTIKKAKQIFNKILLGNGGINNPEDAKKMLDKTGCDGVGLARGLCGRPWLFKQIKDYLKTGRYDKISDKKTLNIAIKHAKHSYKQKGHKGILEMRKHLCRYTKGFPKAKIYRNKLVRVENLEEIKNVLKEIL